MRELVILSGVAAAGLVATWVALRFRKDPNELERRRRALIQSYGRLIDGVCTDVREGLISYRYVWRGVEYECSQDISGIPVQLPDPLDRIVGGITVKFMPNDPPNSIVVSEGWNGFRRAGLTSDNS
jgi:hypothetical protein